MKQKRFFFVLAVVAAFILFTGLSPALAEDLESCVKPAKGPIGVSKPQAGPASDSANAGHQAMPLARVGLPAPDFEANAFVNGGFKNIRLSEYKGKWVVLCFYPGDFTFV